MFPVSREFADPVSAMEEETIGSQQIGRRSPSPPRLDDSADEDSESEDEPDHGVEASTATPLSRGATVSADASGSAESLLFAREWAGKKEGRQKMLDEIHLHSTKQGHSVKQDRKEKSGTRVIMRCDTVLDNKGFPKPVVEGQIACDYKAVIDMSRPKNKNQFWKIQQARRPAVPSPASAHAHMHTCARGPSPLPPYIIMHAGEVAASSSQLRRYMQGQLARAQEPRDNAHRRWSE